MTIELRCKHTYKEQHFNLHGYRLKYQHTTVLTVYRPTEYTKIDFAGNLNPLYRFLHYKCSVWLVLIISLDLHEL
jgi:hypothetical protein